MNTGPAVGVLREAGVAVQDVELKRKEEDDEGQRHEKQTHEAGFIEVGGGAG